MVLVAASPYFEDIFKGNPSRKLVVVLVGVKAWEVTALLDYMYEGECRIRDQAQLEQLLGTAEVLKIKGLQGGRSSVMDDGTEIGGGQNNLGDVMEDWDEMMGMLQGHSVPRLHAVDALSAFGAAVTCSSGQFGTSLLPNTVASVDGDRMTRVRVPQPHRNQLERVEQKTDEEEEDREHQSPPIQQNLWKSMQPPESEAKACENGDDFQDRDGNRNEVVTNYVSEGSGEPSNASRGRSGTKQNGKKSPKTRRSCVKYQGKIGDGNGSSGGGRGRTGSSTGRPRPRCFPKLTREERAARCQQAAELIQHDAVSIYNAALTYGLPNSTVSDYLDRQGIQWRSYSEEVDNH